MSNRPGRGGGPPAVLPKSVSFDSSVAAPPGPPNWPQGGPSMPGGYPQQQLQSMPWQPGAMSVPFPPGLRGMPTFTTGPPGGGPPGAPPPSYMPGYGGPRPPYPPGLPGSLSPPGRPPMPMGQPPLQSALSVGAVYGLQPGLYGFQQQPGFYGGLSPTPSERGGLGPAAHPMGRVAMSTPSPPTKSYSLPQSPQNGPSAGGVTTTERSLLPSHPGLNAPTRGGPSPSDNIKVVVRVRPFSESEARGGEPAALRITDDRRALEVAVPGNPRGQPALTRLFPFHAVLGPQTSQAEVLLLCGVQQLLDSALAGYASTIFAYGQTGSGKTFSMAGKEEAVSDSQYAGHAADGIMARSISYLFGAIGSPAPGVKYVLRASYLEIYNEQIFDLLSPSVSTPLPVRWSARRGFYVQNLLSVDIRSQKDALAVMSHGMRNRMMGSHELNMDSSRSHCILTVYIESTSAQDGRPLTRYGKVSFVDLAGSERLKQSKSSGEAAKETSSINRSLFTLGKVIAALGDPKQAGEHIPYRDSKLTKLLMDSLGGNSLALMIACCSPLASHVEETLTTLYYATRAKNIRNQPSVQMDPQDMLIAALRKEVDLLRAENRHLRGQLGLGGAPGAPGGALPAAFFNAGGRDGDTAVLHGSLQSTPRPTAPLQASLPQFGTAAGAPVAGGGRAPLPPLESSTSPARPGIGGVLPAASASAVHASGPSGPTLRSPAVEATDAALLPKGELLLRLRESASVLQGYSAANERLEKENETLRGAWQLLELDHRSAVEDIERLQERLLEVEGWGAGGGGAGEIGRGATALSRPLTTAQRPPLPPGAVGRPAPRGGVEVRGSEERPAVDGVTSSLAEHPGAPTVRGAVDGGGGAGSGAATPPREPRPPTTAMPPTRHTPPSGPLPTPPGSFGILGGFGSSAGPSGGGASEPRVPPR